MFYKLCSLLQSLAKQKTRDICFQMFSVHPTKVLTFTINLTEVMSQNEIKMPHFVPENSPHFNKYALTSHPKISILLCSCVLFWVLPGTMTTYRYLAMKILPFMMQSSMQTIITVLFPKCCIFS